MTDQTPPDTSAPSEPAPGVEQPTRFAAARWRTRRVPLAIAGATLLLGCVLGAGAAAVGAVAVGAWTDHGGGNHSDRHERNHDDRGRHGDDDSGRKATPTPTPTATASAATPSPSPS